MRGDFTLSGHDECTRSAEHIIEGENIMVDDIIDESNGDDSDNEDIHGFNEEECTNDENYEAEDVELGPEDLEIEENAQENTRGPTMMHHVHTRSLEERKFIILNKFGQPIGPVTEKEDTIGTIARDYSYCPLTIKSWRKVPNKEKIWEYVLTKYIVSEEGKEWVLKTIGAAWRINKCRFKQKHYYKYKSNKLRWEHRSKRIPDTEFLKLLAMWKGKAEKTRCAKHKNSRLCQKICILQAPKVLRGYVKKWKL